MKVHSACEPGPEERGGSVGWDFRPIFLALRCARRVGRSGRPESAARALSGASGSVGRDGPSQCAAAPWASRSVGTDMFAWCTKIYFSTHTPQPHISPQLHSSTVVMKTARLLGLTKCRAAPDSATLPAPCPGWVGRSGRPDSGLAAPTRWRGSVGRVVPTQKFSSPRCARRSVGRVRPSRKRKNLIFWVGRSRTLKDFQTSPRPAVGL